MNHTSTAVAINWESEAVLSQIATKISKPLKEIIRLSKHLQTQRTDTTTNHVSSVMLESSEQIEALITDILRAEQEKLIRVVVQQKFRYPDLLKFQIEEPQSSQARASAQLEGRSLQPIAKADLSWLMELEAIVLRHLDDSTLSVPWLAEQLLVSERQLFRKIDKYTGLTPNNYIRSLRLYEAKRLLEDFACTTVGEVASRVGIQDPYYFSKLFVREFGVMPKRYLELEHRSRKLAS